MTKHTLIAEPGSQMITLTREFNAPRELVFKAMTDPKLVTQWWGFRSTTTTVDKMEAKAGGVWRFVDRDADGNEFAFRGVYHDVTSPERLVYTFEFEGMPGHVLLETILLEDRDGKTFVTDSSVFQSVEARDGMLEAGLESGAAESWSMMDELLEAMQV
jgi:uncharacterized protein YndB with AHSA1/START domain